MTSVALIRGVALAALLPVVAQAATYQYTAETVAPAAKQGAVMAAGINWQCGSNKCSTSGPWPTPGVSACKALAQQVGTIKAYGHLQKQLNVTELAQCNAGDAVANKLPADKPVLPQKSMSGFAQLPPPADSPAKKPGGFIPKQPEPVGASNKDKTPPEEKKGGFMPAPTPDKSMPAKASPGSISFTTAALTVTGTGALTARLSFKPLTFTTTSLVVTGTGALTAREPFTPKSFTAPGLSITGTGALR